MLAPSLCRKAWYQYASPEALDWDRRARLIAAEISAHDADVLCLQEVEEDKFGNHDVAKLSKPWLKSWLGLLGYTGSVHATRKRGNRSAKPTLGVSIFWKTTVFECIDHVSPVRLDDVIKAVVRAEAEAIVQSPSLACRFFCRT